MTNRQKIDAFHEFRMTLGVVIIPLIGMYCAVPEFKKVVDDGARWVGKTLTDGFNAVKGLVEGKK